VTQLRPPSPPLTDGVVRLRKTRLGDLKRIHRMNLDAEILRWDESDDYTIEDTASALISDRAEWADGSGAHFAIEDAATGTFAGIIGGLIGRTPATAHLSYRIRAEVRGRGFATRALVLVADWLLTEVRVARVELYAYGGNLASQKVAERAGFVREGVLRRSEALNGVVHDRVFYSLIQGERPRRPKAAAGAAASPALVSPPVALGVLEPVPCGDAGAERGGDAGRGFGLVPPTQARPPLAPHP
jgi:RimJ/RimL family protein N-acetyltransferase